jgi:glycosyltransferase involved in cell wall biosynthesis
VKITIAAWHLKNQNVGIGRYCREMIEALGRVDPFNEYQILIPESTHPFQPKPNFHYRLLQFPLFRRRFWEQAAPLIGGRSDLLHFPYDSCVMWKRDRFVVTIHDIKPLLFPELRSKTNLTSRIESWLIGDRWAKIDQVITISEHSRKDILARFPLRPDQVSVTPMGFDAARFRPGTVPSEGKPYVLCVAGSDPTKNVGCLVDAYGRMPAAMRREVDLVLAGDVCKRADIRESVRKLGLESHCKLLGILPDQDLIRLYQQAMLFVFPSLYEGFGLPVLEAMACGIPVICSNTSSLPEVVGETAVMIDPRNADQLAAALGELLRSPARRQELATKALARAKEFTWERTAVETVAAYRRASER